MARIIQSVFRNVYGQRLRRTLAATLSTALLLALCSQAAAQEKAPVEQEKHLLARAAGLMSRGSYREAALILEPLSERHPDLRAAAEHLATCYMEMGEAERAVELLERRVERDGDHFPYARLLGNAYLDLGEREQALAAWRGALSDDPRFARNYGLAGRLMREAGFYEEAIETYRRGRMNGALYRSYTAEIIRLERLLGREETAFREAVQLLEAGPALDVGDVQLLARIYRESGLDEELFAIADSAAAAAGGGRFDIARAVLLLEAGRYREAEDYISGRNPLADREFYAFIRYLSFAWRDNRDTGFVTFYRKALEEFLDLYPGNAVAPEVLLVLAESLREEARLGGDREKLLTRAIGAIGRVREHRWGKLLLERAAILEADILLDDLRLPRKAVEAIEGVDFKNAANARRAEEIHMTALVRAGDWEAVERRAAILETSGDSVKAAIGLYGRGLKSFYRGEYAEAVDLLSSLAESHPWSRYANDALETALLLKGALAGDPAPLDCYRKAIALREAGERGAASDSLEALVERYPSSSIVPRALYERAELDLLSGERERAERGLEKLAESHPLSELAPRALERLAALERKDDPKRAMRRYETILERYPDDPFLERVRRAYLELRRSNERVEE